MARWVVKAPVENWTILARLKFMSVASVEAVKVVWAGAVMVISVGEPVVAATGAKVNP